MAAKKGQKGGRGCKAGYSSSTVRVPDPLRGAVERMIEEFHEPKPVTSFKQIAPEKVARFLKITSEDEEGRLRQDVCYSEYKSEYDRDVDLSDLGEWMALGDEINQIIWQYDNSFVGVGNVFERNWSIAKMLIRYKLVSLPPNQTRANTLEYAAWIEKLGETGLDIDLVSSAAYAVELGRYDILAAIYDGFPIDRRDYWRNYYTSQMGKTAEYWLWKNNPEAFNVCPELTKLLSLPQPDYQALLVLEHLKDKIPPFHKTEPKVRNEGGFYMVEIFSNGYFTISDHLWERRDDYIEAFYHWFEEAAAVAETELREIFKICWGCDWARVEDIIKIYLAGGSSPWRVLGLRRGATLGEIKKACLPAPSPRRATPTCPEEVRNASNP